MAPWVGGETEAAKAQLDGTNAWDPRGGWLAGSRGTVRPDVCSASWVKAFQTENFPRPARSESEQPLFPKARLQGPLAPPCPLVRTGSRADTSGPSPVVPSGQEGVR